MANYNRYSHHARRALTHANLLVKRFRHPYVDTGHLLVGVMRTEGSIGYRVLHEMNLNADQAEPHLRALYPMLDIGGEEAHNADALEMTLDFAASEAAWLSHHYIGTEHLLLGITRANAGNASALLRRMGTSSEHLRNRVRRALSEGASETNLQAAKHTARLSELSRRVINAAEQQAVAYDHQAVGIGHLLLVMAQETRSPTSSLLYQNGLDDARLRAGLDQGDAVLMVSIEATLSQVRDLVEQIGSHYTGTEHILLTLIDDPAGREALRLYGVDLAALKHQLRAK